MVPRRMTQRSFQLETLEGRKAPAAVAGAGLVAVAAIVDVGDVLSHNNVDVDVSQVQVQANVLSALVGQQQ